MSEQQPSVDPHIERNRVALEWLKFGIEKFRANNRKLKIGSTGELYKSFAGTLVSGAGGDELKLRLVYAIQGLYVDMGAGREKSEAADARRVGRNKQGRYQRRGRRPKKWFTKQMAREQHRLGELMIDITGRLAIATVSAVTPPQVEINL